ncbi:DUF5991 domain-containing protein [Variovorax sp. KK3]|uniref:DUF5991 domain-containing protein n=1 Tax=Variovorax sp. KK3 TaxID=1855728 RepID=UPI00097BB0E8|nr:DUF5991 domain-containing protein [Variovorax sp. KK3]
MKIFKTTNIVAAAAACIAVSAASAAQVQASGKTLASSQLATDVLNKIAEYVKTSGGCAALDAVNMEVLPRSYVPRQPTMPATARGGHFERWSIDACGSRQQFQVGLWPSPQGGSDFAVTPLSARAPAAPTAGAAQAPPLSAWHGRYVWEEALGRVGGSSPTDSVAIFITYTLSLGPGNGSTGCTLDAEGYQTNERMLCTATPSGPSLVVKFYKFGPDNVRGRHTTGERLLTLTRDGGGIATQLEGLKPASDASARKGRLFRKVG